MASVVSLCGVFVLACVYTSKQKHKVWVTKIGTYDALKLTKLYSSLWAVAPVRAA